jgi:hypothetical protein
VAQVAVAGSGGGDELGWGGATTAISDVEGGRWGGAGGGEAV